MDYQGLVPRPSIKSLRRTLFILFFLWDIIAIVSSQAPGTALQPVDTGGTDIANGINDPRTADATSRPVSTTADDRKASTTAQSGPPVPLDSGRQPQSSNEGLTSVVFIASTISLSVVICLAFFGGMYCWYKVLIPNDYQPMDDDAAINHNTTTNKKMAKLAEKTDYPAYGVTGPNPLHCADKGPPIDLNLTRNAEVYHYQQQKKRLKKISSVSSNESSRCKRSTPDASHDPTADDVQVDEENSDGEYTVYECPGLAAASDGPLEIHNPLFANSDSNSSSYSASTLGGSITTSKYDYSTTVGGR